MLDPGELAANTLQKHFDKFGTFRRSCTYVEALDPDYDITSGDVTPKSNGSHPGLMVIFSEFNLSLTFAPTKKEDDAPILAIDRIAIFPSLNLSATPDINHLLIDEVSGQVWKVMGIAADPKPAHHELHVRPIS